MKYILPLAIMLVLTSCNKKTEPAPVQNAPEKISQLGNAAWLLGNWGNTSPEGTLVENWVKKNDSVYNGESYFIVGKDTVFAETVVLNEVNGDVAYTVTVPNQNGEKPVRFGMTGMTEKEMVFENPAHDFPNKIVYTLVQPDSLVAVIYGKKDGKDKSETFAMKKIK